MLEVRNLVKHFGGVRAVDGLDFKIKQGEVFGLIGPNGSGKSTTVNLVCGIFPPTDGEIMLGNINLGAIAPHQRVDAGVARTFQNIRLFGDLTVWQNLWVAWRDQPGQEQGWVSNWFGRSTSRRQEIQKLLEFSGLGDKADHLASNLAFGEQRRLELARAMAAKPKIILLDEPAAGMNSAEVKDLCHRVLAMKEMGMTVLLVEHVMELVMNVTDRITVLNFGRPIAQGTPLEIQNNKLVQEAYFGSSENAQGGGN
ncbi:MAG: ABC transporter ATP-binding protein [Gammaproteobacteria bacterium]|nr:ABC transporter ATP-binding protein [Gammaproteobacteria bacterium]MCP4880346.1 ABC transporter ATP-binding protein [Gammaproteobacteria bacterium]